MIKIREKGNNMHGIVKAMTFFIVVRQLILASLV